MNILSIIFENKYFLKKKYQYKKIKKGKEYK